TYKEGICPNVEEGFVFCGDTAQTIGRGINFRFQDVRALFYNKFLLESKSWNDEKYKEKEFEFEAIVVRDDETRKEILPLVGEKTLVLTILECKGLQFK
ncbi:hypothetical protein S245_039799, partial [Arachis hypogaea]